MRNLPFVYVLTLASIIGVSHQQNLVKETCDAQRLVVDVSTSNANAILGGIFDIRQAGTADNGFGCGQPYSDLILSYEAARYAIKQINDKSYIPGVKIGMKAYDTCSSLARAQAAAQNFYPQTSSGSMYCNQSQKINLGILGSLSSPTSKSLAALTSTIPVSMISPRAASPELSVKSKYPYFMRTASSVTQQIRAVLTLLKNLGWERAILVSATTDSGMDYSTEFIRMAQNMGICVVNQIFVPQQGSASDYIAQLKGIGSYGVAAAVYFIEDNIMNNIFNVLGNVTGSENLQWVLSSYRTNSKPPQIYARGTIVVEPKFTYVTDFFDYFVNNLNENNPPPENPWLQDWYMTTFGCRLQGINYAPYNQYAYCTPKTNDEKKAALNQNYAFVDSTIKAVYSYARALQQAQMMKCGSGGGFCLSLQEMTSKEFHENYLSKVDFTFDGTMVQSLTNTQVKFDGNGDLLTSDFSIWNYNDLMGTFQFVQVGSYLNGQLTINSSNLRFYTMGGNPSSRCPPEGCQQCLIPADSINFEYEPGDILIGGVFSVHNAGTESLSCDSLHLNNAYSAVAFRYAVQVAKSSISNVSLGSILADNCGSGMSGRMFFDDLLGKRRIIRDKMGRVIDPNQLKAVVGYQNSDPAIKLAEMFGGFYTPYVETTASSVVLSSKEIFPFFNSAIPPDSKQVAAMVQLLKRLGWTYIQTIQAPNSYGRFGIKYLRELAAYYGICVADSYEIGTDGNYADIVQKLNHKPDARAVVVFAYAADFRGLLQALKARNIPGQFILIGSETWGTDSSITAGLEDIASGSLTFQVETSTTQGFDNWLRALNPLDPTIQKDMPFFIEWYQYAHNCYIDAANRGYYITQCTNQPITAGPNFHVDQYAYFVIYAVKAVVKALDNTVKYFCGSGYTQVCSAFRSNVTAKDVLLANIRNISVNTEDNKLFEIMNGEGMADYVVYNYIQGRGYVQAGIFDTATSLLNLNMPAVTLPIPTFTSKCALRCGECAYTLQQLPFIVDQQTDIKLGVSLALRDPSSDPFLCGNVRLGNGIQNFYATSYALDVINKKLGPVRLNGIRLGALFMDHCNSQARAYGLPNALYAGILKSPSQVEPMPSVDKIRGWMTYSTLGAEELKDLVNSMSLPLISPSATSTFLVDDNQYPTFYRTVKGDSTVSSAMAKLLKSLNLPYVSVLYSANSFGTSGRDAFASVASQEGICILQSYEMTQTVNMADLVSTLISQPSHVVITYLTLRDMQAFLEARNSNAMGYKIVVVSPEPWTMLMKQLGNAGQNVLSVKVKSKNLEDFKNFIDQMPVLTRMDNPYIAEYYEDLFTCNLPGNHRYALDCRIPLAPISSNPLFVQEDYVIPIINAVYSWAAAIEATVREKCGDTYNGVCTSFLKDNNTNSILLYNLQKVSFMDLNGDLFTFKNHEGSTGHEIHLYDGNQYKKVGEFAGASVVITAPDLLKRFEGTESTCPTPCAQCIQNTMEFTYIPGDILLGGLFDVHDAALAPFSCGSVKTWHGFQLLEAFHYAINKVNVKSGQFANILKNVKLGGIGLDSCESAIRSGFLISNIHNGLSVLQRAGVTIDPNDINAYVGSYSSDQSIHVARLLKTLKIPQISYGSTSMSLADPERFPYFLRTVPNDEKQSTAMIEFLNKFDIRYVQIVHTSSNYGEQGAAIFTKVAKESNKKICIAQTIVFPDNGTVSQESANDVVTALLNKPVANTVIIFADTSYINELLRAIIRKPEAANNFKFIGSDTWANNPEAIAGVEQKAEKSVTFDLESFDINDFDTYLSTKTPDNYPENPWFPEYYQQIENCYLSSVDRRYPGRCPSTPQNIVVSPRYKQDTVILHVINAVYAAAYGIDKALREVCGNDYTTVCEPFKNNQDRRDILLRNIKNAQFVDPSGQNFNFGNGTDGNKGYIMYSIEPSVTFGYAYTKVGMYDSMDVLAMNPVYSPVWNGSCRRFDSCLECPTVRNTLSRYMLQPHSGGAGNPATIVAFMNVHGSAGLNTYRCGEISATSDFLNALAFFYILDKNIDGLRAFDVRGLVIDLCGQAVRVNQDAYRLLSSGTLCNSDFDPAGTVINKSSIAAFVTPGSDSSIEANRILSPLQIPFISYSASAMALKDQEQYPYFARVVPPDDKQSLVIAQILKQMRWNYVSVVYSKEPYGISGQLALQQKVYDMQASCIALSISISRSATIEEAKDVVRQLIDKSGADVVVLFTVNPDVILKAANALGVLDKFLWIGVDTWGSSLQPVIGLESKVVGSITIEFRNAEVKEFRDWVGSLSYTNRYFIPDDWFEEFYQVMNECYLPDAVVVRHEFNGTLCRKDERIVASRIPPELSLSTMAATYAIKRGLYNFKKDFCGTESFTQCLENVTGARDKLFQKILASEWQIDQSLTLMPNEDFHLIFNSERYWNVGYKINQFVRNGISFTYREIGRQIGDDPFRLVNVQMYHEVVSSCPVGVDCNCNLPASAGFQAQTANNSSSKSSKEPRNVFLYNDATRVRVYDWPIWAIVIAVLSCLGLIIGVILFIYLLVSYPVKGGTSSLGFLVIFGILCIYATNFAFYHPASEASCGARRFLMGVVYSVIFSALFIKALDNWRFSGTEYSVQRYRGITSSYSLFLMAVGIICIEVIIPVEWLILKHPTASKVADNVTNDWMWCDPVESSDLHLVVSMYFVCALLVLTAIFSALSWDSESNYYESRWIFVSTVCTAGCLMVWMIVSTNARPLYRDPAIVIANFVNATALLICIPLRKLVLLCYIHNFEEKEGVFQTDNQDQDMHFAEYNNEVFEPDIFQNIDYKHESDPEL
ncbi:hypothetical protein ACJMK2_011309 [Sinanodonta woodiana]|uniref:G-protein coupled receptors family 3 profile domain-containing protein n=1 Tax=Sinanodonta woodiana TaxID=1069815 RepID=A0ABD3V4M9_SINWO